jgi:hypothetical protein
MVGLDSRKEDRCPWWCQKRIETCQRELELRREIINARLDAMDEALILRTSELEKRLEGLNQLRGDVVQDRSDFVRKEYYDIEHKRLSERFDNIALWRAGIEGKQSWSNFMALAAIVVSIAFGVAHLIWGRG